jgi:hypothetical protein
MVKKADASVCTHSHRMHIADSALQTFTTMILPQEITAAIQRTGTSKYFTGITPVKPKKPMPPPLKSALKSTPGIQFQRKERPVAHVAAKDSSSKAPSPVTNVASALSSSKTQYPPKDLSKVKCFKCDQMGHFAYNCPIPSKKTLSERPNAYQRTKSPGPNHRKPPVQNAHVAVQGSSCKIDDVFEWDKEEAGLGCVTVHTAPVSVGFNVTYLTDTVTDLPITAHTPATSLLDDVDIESQPGPPSPNISPALQFQYVRERERAFQESQ